jgi:hypothetical protein
MIRRTMEFRNEREALAAEQAIAMVRELEALADAAPDGAVLAVVEREAVERGRRFVRDRLQDVLNAQAEGPEQKGGAPGDAPAAGPAGATARPSGASSRPPGT